MARSLVVVESPAKAKAAPRDGEPIALPIEHVLFHKK
ncbi:MAG: hypothetical protein H6Q83_1517 [Deltaproteobacteria bacterium]|nr:hypothetical protein [Deltaproteobacteria bacterium]